MEQNPNVEIKVRVYRLVRLLGLSFLQWQQAATFRNILSRWITPYLQQYQQSGQLADLDQFIDSGVIDTCKITQRYRWWIY